MVTFMNYLSHVSFIISTLFVFECTWFLGIEGHVYNLYSKMELRTDDFGLEGGTKKLWVHCCLSQKRWLFFSEKITEGRCEQLWGERAFRETPPTGIRGLIPRSLFCLFAAFFWCGGQRVRQWGIWIGGAQGAKETWGGAAAWGTFGDAPDQEQPAHLTVCC